MKGPRSPWIRYSYPDGKRLDDEPDRDHSHGQSREADSVIIVLGAQKAAPRREKLGSRTPNLLNVAVSRAKQNLYVVGSFGAWSGADTRESSR